MNMIYLVNFRTKCTFTVVAPNSQIAKDLYLKYGSFGPGGEFLAHFCPSERMEIVENPQRFRVRLLGAADRDIPVGVVTSASIFGKDE